MTKREYTTISVQFQIYSIARLPDGIPKAQSSRLLTHFLARARAKMYFLLLVIEAVTDFTILGTGGMGFGDERYLDCLQQLTGFSSLSSLQVPFSM